MYPADAVAVAVMLVHAVDVRSILCMFCNLPSDLKYRTHFLYFILMEYTFLCMHRVPGVAKGS